MRGAASLLVALGLASCAASPLARRWTADGRVIEVQHRMGMAAVSVDGVRGQWLRSIAVNGMSMSSNGAHLAYAARVEGQHVIFDGPATSAGTRVERAGAPFDEVGPPVVAADGTVAYAARRGHATRVVIRRVGVERAGPRTCGATGIALSSDGRHVAYLATLCGGRGVAVVRDHRLGAPAEAVAQFAVAAQGAALRTAAIVRSARGWHVDLDGARSGPFDAVGNIAFSDDGRHAGAMVRDRTGWHVARHYDGQLTRVAGPFVALRPETLGVLDDGAIVAAAVTVDGDQLIRAAQVVSALGPHRAQVRRVATAGATVAFVAEEPNRETVYLNATPVAVVAQVHDLALAPDGRLVISVMEGAHERVVLVRPGGVDRWRLAHPLIAGTLGLSPNGWNALAVTGASAALVPVQDGALREPLADADRRLLLGPWGPRSGPALRSAVAALATARGR